MMKQIFRLVLLGLIFASSQVAANDVMIVRAVLTQQGDSWRADVTLKHADSGWEHYADAWRVVDDHGKELGKRILYHPHEHEQPFTRSLSGIKISKDKTMLFIEAHDKVHGWSPNRLQVDMSRPVGENYKVVKQQ